MSSEKILLKKLKPVRFPSKGKALPAVTTVKGRPTKEVIAEMRRLSKKGYFVVE